MTQLMMKVLITEEKYKLPLPIYFFIKNSSEAMDIISKMGML